MHIALHCRAAFLSFALLATVAATEPTCTPVPVECVCPPLEGHTWSRRDGGNCAYTPADGLSGVYGTLQFVPAGPFTMGCDGATEPGCLDDQGPPHAVTVPRFWIDRTEVTNAAFRGFLQSHGNSCSDAECLAVFGANHRITEEGSVWIVADGFADHPAVDVTWYGARAFCVWGGKRLCTEAEWEKAARGTDRRVYPWGDATPTCEHVSIRGCDPHILETPVGSRPAGASPYGVLDLAGSAWEWVEDDFHYRYDDPPGAPLDGSAWLDDPRPPYRVVRGGDFESDLSYFQTVFRTYDSPGGAGFLYSGFRCCLSAE